jgi:hypothetical protein
MTMRRTTLGAPDPQPLLIRGGPALALAAQLTRVAWSMSGRPLPRYGRAETPYTFVRNPARTP